MAEENGKPCGFDEHSIAELDTLLRKKLGEDLIVEKYTATNFLPPGENYGSLILKVDAVIRRKGKDSKKEELHMIAKVPPLTQQQRDFFDSPYTFAKESFMYDTVLPTYSNFERECGIDEDDVFDVGPKFYGSRLSLEADGPFDDHAAILLENLKSRGYYSGDRYTGLDIHHSRVIIKAMARFHALGIAIKSKKPDFFEVLKIRSKCLEMKDPTEWEEVSIAMHTYVYFGGTRTIKEDPVMGEYYDKCAKAMKAGEDIECWMGVPVEPWSTIIHADFWINNILFHRNEDTGLPDDIKFIDFQNYLFLSPLRELCFALGTAVDHDVTINHIPELIDLYHETLISRLEIMGCDVSPYTRDKFDERLPKDAFLEFGHSIFMLKITTKNVDVNDPKSRNVKHVVLASGSDQFYARTRDLVLGYVNRGWL